MQGEDGSLGHARKGRAASPRIRDKKPPEMPLLTHSIGFSSQAETSGPVSGHPQSPQKHKPEAAQLLKPHVVWPRLASSQAPEVQPRPRSPPQHHKMSDTARSSCWPVRGPRQRARTQHRVPSPCSQSVCRRGCLGGEDTGPNRPSPRPSSHHTRCHFIFPNEVTNCKSLKIPTQPIVMKSQKQARPCLKVIAANLQQRWTEKDTIKAKKAFDRQILLQIFGLIQPVCKHLVYYQYFQTLPLQGLLKIRFLLKMINLRVTCFPKSPRS